MYVGCLTYGTRGTVRHQHASMLSYILVYCQCSWPGLTLDPPQVGKFALVDLYQFACSQLSYKFVFSRQTQSEESWITVIIAHVILQHWDHSFLTFWRTCHGTKKALQGASPHLGGSSEEQRYCLQGDSMPGVRDVGMGITLVEGHATVDTWRWQKFK